MTYLELCVRVREESGVSGTGPASTINQVGVLAKIIGWVRDADLDIQRFKTDWKFLWRRAQSALVVGQQSYSATELSLSDLKDINRFWVNDTPVRVVDWDEWVDRYEPQGTGQGMPQVVTIAPDLSFMFYPVPDSNYSTRTDYFKMPVALTADSDVSAIPAAYHDCIVQKALIYYGKFEEDQNLIQLASLEYEQKLSELCRDYLPKMGFARGPY
ncbi:hypothetical protein [Shewanella sp. MM_2022_3]|uniref:phage adaptor protein n=1 Tax=Shewanella sp. MM_2022_3 TaxID=2923280 RepID=UPI001F4C3BAE|nr:hypothetical protein [Shewanella sp. MM_2022_3]MCH7421304.1 hypothetical protein [Shewanella sp. MM_2022_3]